MRLLCVTRNDVTFKKCYNQKVKRKIRLTSSIVGRMFIGMILGLLENRRMFFDIGIACDCSFREHRTVFNQTLESRLYNHLGGVVAG